MGILHELLPSNCFVCGATFDNTSTPSSELLRTPPVCAACREALRPPIHPNRCAVCSIPLPRFIETCERCRRESFSFERAFAVHRYSGVAARLVHAYKFHRHPSLGRFVATLMVPTVATAGGPGVLLVPAPSRRATIRQRGFAGATLIARELGRLTGLPVAELLVARAGRSQKSLSYAARRENAQASIAVAARRSVPSRVLLVDDIFTTGTTANSCAVRLLEAGARTVSVVAFAIDY